MTTEEKIAELREQASKEWAEGIEAHARHYDALAEVDRLQGNGLSAEFHASLSACYRNEPGATERKDRAYVRLLASRCLDGNFAGIPPENLDAVKAEVERLRFEQAACPCGHKAKEHGHGGSGFCMELPCPCVAFGEERSASEGAEAQP